MNKNIFTMLATVAILAVVFTSCRNDDEDPYTPDTPDPIEVEGVNFDWPTASMEVGEEMALTVVVTPADATDAELTWTSSAPTVVTVVDGVLTAVATGTVTITATAGEFDDEITITVVAVPTPTQCGSLESPPFPEGLGTVTFISDETWTIGGLTWSDAVRATGADKTSYAGGSSPNFLSDGRHNRGGTMSIPLPTPPWNETVEVNFESHLFSWAAVINYRNELCPPGWRVPRAEDFQTLFEALGGTGTALVISEDIENKLLSEWGGEFTGQCNISGALTETGITGSYWSLTEIEGQPMQAVAFRFGRMMNMADWSTNNHSIMPRATGTKMTGMTVRCVR